MTPMTPEMTPKRYLELIDDAALGTAPGKVLPALDELRALAPLFAPAPEEEPPVKHECDTCEYLGEKSGEHCNSMTDCWVESRAIKNKRIERLWSRIAALTKQLNAPAPAEIEKAVEELVKAAGEEALDLREAVEISDSPEQERIAKTNEVILRTENARARLLALFRPQAVTKETRVAALESLLARYHEILMRVCADGMDGLGLAVGALLDEGRAALEKPGEAGKEQG